MLRAPKTVLDSVFNADSVFDIFQIVKNSYFLKIFFLEIKNLENFGNLDF